MTSVHAPLPPSDWLSSSGRSAHSVSDGESELVVEVTSPVLPQQVDPNFSMLQDMQQKLSSLMQAYQPADNKRVARQDPERQEASHLYTKRRKAVSQEALDDGQLSKRQAIKHDTERRYKVPSVERRETDLHDTERQATRRDAERQSARHDAERQARRDIERQATRRDAARQAGRDAERQVECDAERRADA
ncbi:octapeptide-repeat protein T2-like [Palaemon carinicauda]|uniref:octapeptide-repeat protein T2-like n=1 Tax=Palaemon carinicauda TaxID=392227 RepID=UPI0035B5A364